MGSKTAKKSEKNKGINVDNEQISVVVRMKFKTVG